MNTVRKFSDDAVAEAYTRLRSVWKVGAELGVCGQSVHERLQRAGQKLLHPRWSDDDADRLSKTYTAHRDAGTLDVLAKEFGRTKQFICRKARLLGLTDQFGPKNWNRVWKGISHAEARKHFDDLNQSGLHFAAYCRSKAFDPLGFSRILREHFPEECEALLTAIPNFRAYRNGRQLEYRFRNALRDAGYVVVLSAGSRGPIDLVAMKPGVVLFIQVKSSLKLSVKEWNAVFDAACKAGAVPILASRMQGDVMTYMRLARRRTPKMHAADAMSVYDPFPMPPLPTAPY